MLVLGLGGIGTQVARRANDLGMRVIGTRNSSRSGPEFVEYVGLSNEMVELAAQANVVVNALPLTDATRLAVNAEFLDNMPDGSYYVSVGRGGTTDTDALVEALRNGKLAGAGLDVTARATAARRWAPTTARCGRPSAFSRTITSASSRA